MPQKHKSKQEIPRRQIHPLRVVQALPGFPGLGFCAGERTAYEPENPETISVKTREKEEAKDLTLSYAGAAVLVLILVIGLLAAGIRKRKKKKFSCSLNQMWKQPHQVAEVEDGELYYTEAFCRLGADPKVFPGRGTGRS